MEMVWLKVRDMCFTRGVISKDADLDELQPIVLQMIGFVIKETIENLIIATEFCNEGSEDYHGYREVTAIPKETIIGRKVLKES